MPQLVRLLSIERAAKRPKFSRACSGYSKMYACLGKLFDILSECV